jgi:uncharacterized protein (TIGR03437 family)
MKLLCALIFAAAAWAQSPTINDFPSREFGQLKLDQTSINSGAPNLVEGRELNSPQGIAFDTSVSPPILYVADTFNNRVLAWRDPASLSNGAPADMVIGQRDRLSTGAWGPGTSFSAGLYRPTSVAVDALGNLYVLDAGNNRILRYPAPFRQPAGDPLSVDLVIGQRGVSSGRFRNEGNSQPSEKTMAFQPYDNGPLLSSGMTFDRQGNLWVADAGNNRVLRFPGVVNLAANTPEPQADIVLGQTSFTTGTVPGNDYSVYPDGPRSNPNILAQPSSVAVDAAGRLYVTDNYGRVLYYSPVAQFAPAARILGIPHKVPSGTPPPQYPNNESVGYVDLRTGAISAASGIFTDGTYLYVCDTPNHRITRYDSPERWLAATATVPSPTLAAEYGQPDFNSGKKNRGQVEANASGFNLPVAGAFLGTDMWIVDTGNNRVVDFPAAGTLSYANASRVLGQLDFGYGSPNLVEGRELWLTGSFVGGDVVVDKTSTPPHLYIADTFNNRILGFYDARRVGTDTRSLLTQTADLVIGQSDRFHTTVNYPSGVSDQPSDTGLNLPAGLAVDGSGNLWVADTGNGRVLRFPAPFAQPKGVVQHATVVLGKGSFTAPPLTDAGVRNMNSPFGLTLLSNGSLAVSDIAHNRVLVFKRPAGGDFVSNAAADIVLGQSSFDQSASGSGQASLKTPTHLAVDSSDRLYVCDTGNNRLQVFTNAPQASNGATAAFSLGGAGTSINSPQGVAVSQISGEIWLANTGANTIFRLPEFTALLLNPTSQVTQIGSPAPAALALDPSDNLIVAEGFNRVSFYFAKLIPQHAASYNSQPLAPGQLAYLYRLGADFDLPAADGTSSNPWPNVLSDYKVTVNGIPAPIFRLNKTRIDFMVPMSAPSSGTAEFLVQRDSTGEIVGTVTYTMAESNPGFFTANATGTGQAAAVNEDGTVNGPGNCVGRGHIISFYLTGQGYVPGAPPDGAPPSGPVPTPVLPTVVVDTVSSLSDPSIIQYSGLGAFAGGWQLNIKVPEAVPPKPNAVIALTMRDRSSRIGPTSTPLLTTFCVK